MLYYNWSSVFWPVSIKEKQHTTLNFLKMREEQADRIIELLEEITQKLPAWTAYDLSDIYSEIGTVKNAIDDLKVAVDDVKDSVNNLNLG